MAPHQTGDPCDIREGLAGEQMGEEDFHFNHGLSRRKAGDCFCVLPQGRNSSCYCWQKAERLFLLFLFTSSRLQAYWLVPVTSRVALPLQ